MPQSWSDQRIEQADLAACRKRLCGGSRSFFAASWLLPSRIVGPASALYAFCRVADDAIDQSRDQHAALTELRERLHLIYRGAPQGRSEDRAFARVVEQYQIPRALPEALLEGFEWDASDRRYQTFAELNAYAARVAGTVGAMMTILMGVREADALARACDLGVAMQLTNIARDVGEDARAGRIYLPLDWLRQAGVDPDAWLAGPSFTPPVGSVVRRLLRRADVLYRRADAGIGQLPGKCRPGIRAARHLYAGIGHRLVEQGLDSVSSRTVVPPAVKARLLMRSLAPRSAQECTRPPLPQTRFLVDSVTARANRMAAPVAIGGRMTWLIELVDRLERRDRDLDLQIMGSQGAKAPLSRI
jgi:phytoene synthase